MNIIIRIGKEVRKWIEHLEPYPLYQKPGRSNTKIFFVTGFFKDKIPKTSSMLFWWWNNFRRPAADIVCFHVIAHGLIKIRPQNFGVAQRFMFKGVFRKSLNIVYSLPGSERFKRQQLQLFVIGKFFASVNLRTQLGHWKEREADPSGENSLEGLLLPKGCLDWPLRFI